MERSIKPKEGAARRDAPRPPRLVVSFVDRNWLWSRAGLALSLILAVVIAVVTLTPLPPGPVMPAGIDKIYHFAAYFALVFPVIVTDTNRWSWAVPAAIAFGGTIELIQPFVGRNADWLDFGASVSGVLAGAALAEILHNRIRRSVLGPEPDLRTMVPLESEQDRLEVMRAELMAELRAVLREELEAAALRGSPSRHPDAIVYDDEIRARVHRKARGPGSHGPEHDERDDDDAQPMYPPIARPPAQPPTRPGAAPFHQ